MLTPMYDGLAERRRHQARILEECTHLFNQGELQVKVSHTLPLEAAAEAHRLIEQGGMTGKVVLTLD